VARARVDIPVWEACLQSYWAPNFYIFTRETETPEADVHARMFGPEAGVVEDAATGSAAAALAAVLASTEARQSGTLRWRIEQGFEMKRPSLIELEADRRDGEITAVRVGGQAVMMSHGDIHVRR
jgi:trans-2,3-dihydro-3-hydroxyanthranilate isomerase